MKPWSTKMIDGLTCPLPNLKQNPLHVHFLSLPGGWSVGPGDGQVMPMPSETPSNHVTANTLTLLNVQCSTLQGNMDGKTMQNPGGEVAVDHFRPFTSLTTMGMPWFMSCHGTAIAHTEATPQRSL